MMAGKKAFRGESITGLIFKIITEEPPPIRELDPDDSRRDGADHRQGAGQGAGRALPERAASWPTTSWP